MKKRFFALFLAITLCSPLLFSCSKNEKQTAETFKYFDTYSTLTVYCEEKEFTAYENEFRDTLKEYHELFDIYNSYDGVTNLKAVNELAKASPTRICDELFEAISLAKELCELTDGKFNPALGAVTSIWREVRLSAESSDSTIAFPTENTIASALSHTDYNKIILNQEEKTVFFEDPLLLLDFGAIAKGYVATKLCERLISLDCESFLINLGGNVLSHGKKPNGESWNALVENPFSESSLGYNEKIALNDATLVTSGSYQRFFEYNGKSYSHVIDSESGYPAEGFASVTIKAPSSKSALADVLSTALFCMSYEEGLSLISQLDGVSALWIFNDGSYKLSSDNFASGGEVKK